MKTKAIILLAITISIIGLFSFKALGDKESSNIALVSTVFGKGENEGFLITYGDGSQETRPYEFIDKKEKVIESISKIAIIIGEMHLKGYRYVGEGSHIITQFVPFTKTEYMVFEKK